jgi:hypothetical protein
MAVELCHPMLRTRANEPDEMERRQMAVVLANYRLSCHARLESADRDWRLK